MVHKVNMQEALGFIPSTTENEVWWLRPAIPARDGDRRCRSSAAPLAHSEFKANLCCVRTCFPNKNKQQKINKTISYTLLEEKCFPSLSSGSASFCLWESPPPWSLSTQFNVSEKLSFLCHEKKHLALLLFGATGESSSL